MRELALLVPYMAGTIDIDREISLKCITEITFGSTFLSLLIISLSLSSLCPNSENNERIQKKSSNHNKG